MKKKILLLSIITLFCSAQLFSQGMPNDWYLDELNPGADIALYPEDAMVYEGTLSCKMVLLSNEVPYLYSFFYDVTEGTPYTFSIWYLDNDSRGSLKFYADFIDSEGEPVYGEDPVYSEDSENWQNITWSANVPTGAVQGQVWIKFYDDPGFIDEAVIYIDDASFEVLSTNLVSNGSYESWDGVFVPEVENTASMQVYPNPAEGFIGITGLDYDRIQICNLLGQQVHKGYALPGQKIGVDHLAKGLYILNAYKENQFQGSTKMMKR
jgi:hypothetical protein